MKKLIFGYVLSVVFLISFVALNPYFGIPSVESELNSVTKLLVVAASISGMILFFWMIVDLFKRKPVKRKIFWGLSFLVLNMLAAPFYYMFIYYPAENSKMKAIRKNRDR